MSERAREFLDHWLADHVASVDDTRRLRETVRLVTLCREDAVRAVINWVEKNSNWNESVLLVSSDHGHYLVVDDPQALAK